MSSKWLINLKPKNDELLSSWLIRTSVINGDEPIGWTQNIWGKWRAWTTDLDRLCPADKITSLSKVSGLSESQLNSMTLKPTIEKLLKTPNINSRWPWVIPKGHRNRMATNGLHFCVDCLCETPIYFKKSWRLAWNVACPTHKNLLTINCPECGMVISPHLITYTANTLNECVHCKYDLRNTQKTKAIDEVIEFQELLNNSLLDKKFIKRNQKTLDISSAIKTTDELFNTTLFLMKFFYSVRRFDSSYTTLIESLGITNESEKCPIANGGVIENLPVEYRQFLLLAVSRFLSLDKPEIIELLYTATISQQRLCIVGDTTSFFLESIKHALKDNPQSRKPHKVTHKEIIPRSKEQVESLMVEIRQYL